MGEGGLFYYRPSILFAEECLYLLIDFVIHSFVRSLLSQGHRANRLFVISAVLETTGGETFVLIQSRDVVRTSIDLLFPRASYAAVQPLGRKPMDRLSVFSRFTQAKVA